MADTRTPVLDASSDASDALAAELAVKAFTFDCEACDLYGAPAEPVDALTALQLAAVHDHTEHGGRLTTTLRREVTP